MIDPRSPVTGQQLVDSIHELAASTGKTPADIAGMLSRNPHGWLRQVAAAARPRQATIDRVRTLIASQTGLEKRPSITRRIVARRPRDGGAEAAPIVVRRAIRPPDPSDRRPPAFSRDPCVRCGTRGELGCTHQQAFAEEPAPQISQQNDRSVRSQQS